MEGEAIQLEKISSDASVTEKVSTLLGPVFGHDASRTAVIIRVLYGLKTAGAAFQNIIANWMEAIGDLLCWVDPDYWWDMRIGCMKS